MKKSNIFANIPQVLQSELFETLLKTNAIRVEKIVSQGHTSPKSGWYDQEQNEWVVLLEGEALLSFENAPDIKLQKGDFLDIKAHTKHKVKWTSSEQKCVWLAVFY